MNFVITLLFGWSGLHKFMQRKYGAGFLYLFTFGVFGIGWVIDIIKCIPKPAARNHSEPSPEILVDSVCESMDPELARFAIPMLRAGKSYRTIAQAYSNFHTDAECDDLLGRISYIDAYHNSLTELHAFSSAGISQYIIHVSADEQICSVCRKMKGKKFPVSSAKIGYNCPPFHRGCRCTIVADLD